MQLVDKFKYLTFFSLSVISASSVVAEEGAITFEDIAANDGAGFDYRSAVSPNNIALEEIKRIGFISSVDPEARSMAPGKPAGAPGVAIFDYDNDGDLDIYVTNALGKANSLYQNQLKQSGELQFVDVAMQAGVAAIEQDSTGTCFGDIDNDGDRDLLVVSNNETPNLLFENEGNGSFKNISKNIFKPKVIRHASGCAMGDVNGDGLLDIAIGNTFDNWFHRLPLVTFDNEDLVEANQLFFNKGNNQFKDKTRYAGLEEEKYITWAISLVDYDLDGDLDIVTADDQGAKAPGGKGGRDDGYVRIYRNNGKGQFSNVTEQAGTDRVGAWMGLAFGDFNSDNNMDIFATNTGYYITAFLQPALDFDNDIGDWTSGWFLGKDDGSFDFPGAGEMIDTPFGWGSSVADYDNDGDSDILFHGSINMIFFVEASNPGAILTNDGDANFSRDREALANSTDHIRRNVQGMAVADLNEDGFIDIVSVSSEDWPSEAPLAPLAPPPAQIGTAFDDSAVFWPTFIPVDFTDFTKGFVWSGQDTLEGTLSVEMSSADNGNNWVKVSLLGSHGLLRKGRSNRDGIGAVVTMQPKNGKQVMRPILAGSSYASQEPLESVFGLGDNAQGTVEVLWPGGVRNKVYNVKAGEDLLVPEIPCSYTNKKLRFKRYFRCVYRSLTKLHRKGHIDYRDKYRFMRSAVRAYFEYRYY